MSEACFVCGRKARRQCPAGAGLEAADGLSLLRPICSTCCGRGRRRSVDCPDECLHFQAGLKTALLRLTELSQDPDFEIRHGEVLHNLRLALNRVRRGRLADLLDSEARQAFANAADTMRTRTSGLIYSYRSPDPRIQMVSDELLAVATAHERAKKGMARTDPAELMQCLKYLERQTAAAEKSDRGTTLFLDLIAQGTGHEFLLREPEGIVRGRPDDEAGAPGLQAARHGTGEAAGLTSAERRAEPGNAGKPSRATGRQTRL